MGDNYWLLKIVHKPISPTCHYNVCLSMGAKRSPMAPLCYSTIITN